MPFELLIKPAEKWWIPKFSRVCIRRAGPVYLWSKLSSSAEEPAEFLDGDYCDCWFYFCFMIAA